MNKRGINKIMAFTLTTSLVLGAVSCSSEEQRESPLETTTTQPVEPTQTSVTEVPESLLTKGSFEDAVSGITAEVDGDMIFESGNVNGTDYTFTIDLSKWDGNTSEDQI